MLAIVPKWDMVRRRWEAFWHNEIIDRAIVITAAPMPEQAALPDAFGMTTEQRWLDVDFVMDTLEANIASTYYAGDSFPCYFPNMGAGVIAGYLGSPAEFADTTVWFHPCVDDLATNPLPVLDRSNRYWQATVELMKAATERAPGNFVIALTDLGGVTDILASLRGTENLLMDMFDAPEQVTRWMGHLTELWMDIYNEHAALLPPGNGTRGWLSNWSPRRTYPLQDDFSCMIAPQLFRDLCLPSLATLTGFLDDPFYHLDGPGAVKHLDALLELPKLRGIQWQPGAGSGPVSEWILLLQKIQNAGKSIFIHVEREELEFIMTALRPEGVIYAVPSATPEEADAIVRLVEKLSLSSNRR